MCAACGVTMKRLVGRFCLKTLHQPHLDDRLAGNAYARSLTIQRFDNPSRKIDVDSLLSLINPASRLQIEVIDNIFLPFLKFFVEVFSFHRDQPARAAGGRSG
jgi:hypothetical protein